MPAILAVDFGSTKLSVAAYLRDHVEVLQINGSTIIPNAVFFGDSISYGASAVRKGERNPEYLLTNLKQLLAKRFDDPDVEEIQSHMGMRLVRSPDGFCNVEVNRGGLGVQSPTDILVGFLNYILNYIDDHHGLRFDVIILGVPPSFKDNQKEALRLAMNRVNVKFSALFEETCAVCCSCDIVSTDEPTPVLVVDCGGGTFDASLVTVSKSVIRVERTNGNPKLGGNDFTNVVLSSLESKLRYLNAFTDFASLPARTKYDLRKLAEEIKIQLSSENKVERSYEIGSKDYNVSFTRSEFEAICKNLFTECENMVQQLLDSLNPSLKPKYLCFSGASFLIPNLQKRIHDICGMDPVPGKAPDIAVVIGLYIYANSLTYGVSSTASEFNGKESPEDMLDGFHDPDQILAISTIPDLDGTFYPIVPSVSSEICIENADMYDLSIESVRGFNTDRRIIYRRNTPRGIIKEVHKLKTIKNKETTLIIYQGNEPFIKDLTPIKKLLFSCDDKHPSNLSHSYYLTCCVKEDSNIVIQLFWEDSKQIITAKSMSVYREEQEKITTDNIHNFNDTAVIDFDGKPIALLRDIKATTIHEDILPVMEQEVDPGTIGSLYSSGLPLPETVPELQTIRFSPDPFTDSVFFANDELIPDQDFRAVEFQTLSPSSPPLSPPLPPPLPPFSNYPQDRDMSDMLPYGENGLYDSMEEPVRAPEVVLEDPIQYQSDEQKILEVSNEVVPSLEEASNPTSLEEYIDEINSLQAKIFKLLNGPCRYHQISVSSQLADVSSWLVNRNKSINDAPAILEKAKNILATLEKH